MTNTGIFCIIVSKFSQKKELGLIVLFVIDKNSEIGLYYTVLSLELSMSWRVKSSGEPLFDSREVV